VQLPEIARYLLWLGIFATADANRREYNMVTTWLPHLLTNTFTLLLPDLLRIAKPRLQQLASSDGVSEIVEEPLEIANVMIRDNPNYVVYVTPLAAGYLLSHPRFNIYKGRMGDLRLAGFGLDTIPHSATAMGLTALVCDTIETTAKTISSRSSLAPIVQWGSRHLPLASAIVLASATIFWEIGEYGIYRREMALRGDIKLINMQWGLTDSLRDIIANTLGWALALILRRSAY
jgi:hypothetical protein